MNNVQGIEKVDQKSSWQPQWMTVSKFVDCTPRNVFHKEMETEKNFSGGASKMSESSYFVSCGI